MKKKAYNEMKETLYEIANAGLYSSDSDDLKAKARATLERVQQTEENIEDDLDDEPLPPRQEDACSLDDECESCQ